ncbi:MAG TPA: copper homeostasis protein CutC [Caulobacteraceae bacterium]
MTRPLLEVCVDGPEGLLAAVSSGADRIELCAALTQSGLTPSPGLMALAATLACPSYAMIRPRAGDFVYSPAEVDVMRRDIDAARAAALPGVVFGASHPSGALDEAVLGQLARHADGLGRTLHRAFDIVPDFDSALETAIGLGFERILTSGGARNAPAGADRIAALVAQAGERIIIMAGAGVTAQTVADLVGGTGVREVHGSCSRPAAAPDPASPAAALGFIQPDERVTAPALVAQMAEILRGLG